MTFESWLLKQRDRDDPIGDLAKDFIRAKKLGHKTINENILSRFNACKGAFKALKKARIEYENLCTTVSKIDH